jgi:putative tricarboxylic transport membrane protein
VTFGSALLVQIWRGATFEAQDAEDVDEDAEPSRKALFLAIAAASIPVVTMVHFGFVVTAALTFFLMTLAFGSRRYLLNLAISLCVAVICYYGFRMLGVQLGGLMPILGA